MSLGAILSIAGNLVQGVAGYRAGQQNAAALEGAATNELQLGADQESVIREQARKAIGEQVASQFSNGFLGGTGSALDSVMESQVNATLDALRIRRAAANKASSYRAQAKTAREQAWFSLASGMLGAGASAYNQKQDWAAARMGTSVPGASRTSAAPTGDGSNMSGGISRMGETISPSSLGGW